MPSINELMKSVSIGIAMGLIVSALGMTISFASTDENQFPHQVRIVAQTKVQNQHGDLK